MTKVKHCLIRVSIVLLTAHAFGLRALAAAPTVIASDAATCGNETDSPPLSSSAGLPDSPGMVQASAASTSGSASQTPSQQAGPQLAPLNHLTILPGQAALPLSSGAKMGIAFRNIVNPGGFALNIASAGISHATDSRPHFGTDSAGFGERVGATVYRSSVKSLFSYGVFPVLFHDDPRYYTLGDAASLKKRLIYAGTRVVLTRKDSGARGINWPQLLAPIVSQGSANGFYPARDQDVSSTVTGILVSYATSAGVYAGKEFSSDIRRKLHLKQ